MPHKKHYKTYKQKENMSESEYINEVDIIAGGKAIKVQPLDGLEHLYIDGNKYEAFNTSGGVASMCDTFKDKVKTTVKKYLAQVI